MMMTDHDDHDDYDDEHDEHDDDNEDGKDDEETIAGWTSQVAVKLPPHYVSVN